MDSTGSVDPPDRPETSEPTRPEDSGSDPPADDAEAPFAAEGFERWRRESAVGTVGTGIARGLQSVFAPPPNQPAIVASVPGDPPDPERLQVILDPDDPSKSVALLPPAHDSGDGDDHDDSDAPA